MITIRAIHHLKVTTIAKVPHQYIYHQNEYLQEICRPRHHIQEADCGDQLHLQQPLEHQILEGEDEEDQRKASDNI